jgi:UDP:flavonoid glycosyltransferase YjiC (YdhE family)
VEKFLAAGEPPIVFTLGSAAVALAGDFFRVSAQAAQILGRRAVLLLGKNPAPPDLLPSVLTWDYLPYGQILPRAAAIVHQGGIGTTAQSLRAGRPMLVVPFAHDQFDNAARIARLGIAEILPRHHYRPPRVIAALDRLLASPAVAAAATEVGRRIRAETGPALACAAVERLLSA